VQLIEPDFDDGLSERGFDGKAFEYRLSGGIRHHQLSRDQQRNHVQELALECGVMV